MELSIFAARAGAFSCAPPGSGTRSSSYYSCGFDAQDRRRGFRALAHGALCPDLACGDVNRAMLDAVHFDVNTMTDTLAAPPPPCWARPRTISGRSTPCSPLDGNYAQVRAAGRIPRAQLTRDLADIRPPLPYRSATGRRWPAFTARRATAFSLASAFRCTG